MDLDSLHEGFLTKESIKVSLRRKGTELSMKAIEGFLNSTGIGAEDHINFAKFKSHILNIPDCD